MTLMWITILNLKHVAARVHFRIKISFKLAQMLSKVYTYSLMKAVFNSTFKIVASKCLLRFQVLIEMSVVFCYIRT